MTRHKCIIIDDEPEVRKRLESLLKKIGNIEILASVGTPEEAVKSVIKNKPDILFIDIELPRMNGFEIIEQVRHNNCFPACIFVTAYNQYAIKAIKNAAFDFILKPVDIDELAHAISRYEDSQENHGLSVMGHQRFECLSNREKEVTGLLLEGLSSKDIAGKLFISKNTVDTHRRNILEKLQLKSTVELLLMK